jgi:hypothetical protein
MRLLGLLDHGHATSVRTAAATSPPTIWRARTAGASDPFRRSVRTGDVGADNEHDRAVCARCKLRREATVRTLLVLAGPKPVGKWWVARIAEREETMAIVAELGQVPAARLRRP